MKPICGKVIIGVQQNGRPKTDKSVENESNSKSEWKANISIQFEESEEWILLLGPNWTLMHSER